MKKIFLALIICFCTMMVSGGYFLIAPFLPTQLALRDINIIFNSTIFGIFNLSAIFITFAGPTLILSRFSKLSALAFGATIQASSLIGMGLISYVPGAVIFLILTHLFRLTQGLGEGFVYQVQYAILTSLYPEKSSFISSLINALELIGAFIGAYLSAFLYSQYGYIGPFLVFGGAILFPGLIILIFYLKSAIVERAISQTNPISFKFVLKNAGACISLLQFCWV